MNRDQQTDPEKWWVPHNVASVVALDDRQFFGVWMDFREDLTPGTNPPLLGDDTSWAVRSSYIDGRTAPFVPLEQEAWRNPTGEISVSTNLFRPTDVQVHANGRGHAHLINPASALLVRTVSPATAGP